MHRGIAKAMLYAIEHLRGEQVRRYLKELEYLQYRPPEEIREYQRQRLHALMRHVVHNNRYFAKKYARIDVVREFTSLPVLTKGELRENYQEMVSENAEGRLDLVETSGSTGQPLTFYRDRVVFGRTLASVYRAHRWLGLEVGSKEAMLWGVPLGRTSRFKARMRDLLLNRFREKEFNLTEAVLADYYDKLRRKRPDYLYGYSSMIYEFALYLKEKNLNGKELKLKAAIGTAEQIHSHQRECIEEVLGCKVYSEYGATETGIISFECRHGSHHVSDDCIYLEIVDEKNRPLPPGTVGKVLVTVLNSHATPIIRYELGDYASGSPRRCSCGVNLSTIEKVKGRTSDIVITPDGKCYHSIIFYYLMKDLTEKSGGIRQFKVHQTAISQLDLYIVRSAGYTEETERYISKKMRQLFGDAMHIRFVYAQALARERSGKLRDFRTDLHAEETLRQLYRSTGAGMDLPSMPQFDREPSNVS